MFGPIAAQNGRRQRHASHQPTSSDRSDILAGRERCAQAGIGACNGKIAKWNFCERRKEVRPRALHYVPQSSPFGSPAAVRHDVMPCHKNSALRWAFGEWQGSSSDTGPDQSCLHGIRQLLASSRVPALSRRVVRPPTRQLGVRFLCWPVGQPTPGLLRPVVDLGQPPLHRSHSQNFQPTSRPTPSGTSPPGHPDLAVVAC